MSKYREKQRDMVRPSKEECEKFRVYYQKDTDFSAYARLLQSKWREKKGYLIGESVRKTKFGNYIEYNQARREKVNFLTENVRNLVFKELKKAKESGALISAKRLWTNMLSSQPLCFNLFGELHYDSELATVFFNIFFLIALIKLKKLNLNITLTEKTSKNIQATVLHLMFLLNTQKGTKKDLLELKLSSVRQKTTIFQNAKKKSVLMTPLLLFFFCKFILFFSFV